MKDAAIFCVGRTVLNTDLIRTPQIFPQNLTMYVYRRMIMSMTPSAAEMARVDAYISDMPDEPFLNDGEGKYLTPKEIRDEIVQMTGDGKELLRVILELSPEESVVS